MAELIVTTPGRTRLRRLRRTRALRNLVAETTIGAEHLIMPHFVLPAKRANEPISSMQGAD
jgi:porphobilinogen synthase